jgi:hypothetical protein
MGPMASRIAALLLVALPLAACTKQDEPVPAACLDQPAAIERALARAPAPVTLADGTALSTCLSRARTDAELQTLGLSLMSVADDLRARAPRDGGAALRLGYLAGATRRGVAHNPGLATQIGRRIDQALRLDGAAAETRAALTRGLQAGEQGG